MMTQREQAVRTVAELESLRKANVDSVLRHCRYLVDPSMCSLLEVSRVVKAIQANVTEIDKIDANIRIAENPLREGYEVQ